MKLKGIKIGMVWKNFDTIAGYTYELRCIWTYKVTNEVRWVPDEFVGIIGEVAL